MGTGQSVLRERFTEVIDLGMATLEQLDLVRSTMPAESYKRCKHVITGNTRVRSVASDARRRCCENGWRRLKNGP